MQDKLIDRWRFGPGMVQDEHLDRWRFDHGVPDDPMFITEMSKYRLYNPAKANLKNGDMLRLVRRPENLDDPNAIEVMKSDGHTFIGYIPREVSAILAPALDADGEISARFHVASDVASGMVVIYGQDLEAVMPEITRLSESDEMDTGLYVKPSTTDMNINWYDQNAEEYDRNANRCNPKSHLHAFISALKPGARILDAGCGNGRDVEAMRALGFDVHAFDASIEMCKLTEKRTHGQVKPRHIRFEDFNDPENSWDGIWAMASLVHTEPEALSEIVAKIRRSLKPNGVFFATLKYGEQNQILKDGRRMMRISEEKLQEAFMADGDLSVVPEIRVVNGRNSNGEVDTWINVMFVRAPEPELRMEI